jgi:hypothetical protein
MLAVVATAPIAARAYGDPQLEGLLRAYAPAILISALGRHYEVAS